jgi:hypothetical protein
MSVAITAPLLAPASPTATPAAGGSLAIGVTYYYRIFATNNGGLGTTGLYGARNWGIPCAEISATTDATNRTINLAWTAVTGATAYEIYRTTVAGDYSNAVAHRLDPKSPTTYLYAPTVTNSLADDGLFPLRRALFLPNGVPVATISSSTEASPDTEETIYQALITAGFGTTHCSKITDVLSVGLSYWLHCSIVISGWWRIQKGRLVLLEGRIDWTNGAYGLTLGEKGSAYTLRQASLHVKWIYTGMYTYAANTVKVYNSHIFDLGGNSLNFLDTHYVCFSWNIVADWIVDIENSIIHIPSLQLGGGASGSIINSIVQWTMQSSGKIYTNNIILVVVGYPLYAYYATSINPVAKNLVVNSQSYDMYFHKSTTVSILDAINHVFKNDPPTAQANANPTNFTVRRKYEATLKLLDENNAPIVGATVKIVDNLGNITTPEVSTATGEIWLTAGTATAGASATLTDSGKSWGTNALADYLVEIYEGTGIGQERSILSNTGTVITLKGTWATNPDATSKYRIKMLVHTHSYKGKATAPYYDTTTYSPHTLTIQKSGFKTYKSKFTLSEKFNQVITLEKVDGLNLTDTIFTN